MPVLFLRIKIRNFSVTMNHHISYSSMRIGILLILIGLNFSICITAQSNNIDKGRITGVWIDVDYEYSEDQLVFKKRQGLEKDSSGFQFLPGGLLTTRINWNGALKR